MADLCRQCSLDTFGEDFGDLAGLGSSQTPPKTLGPGEGWSVICEGCGFILVDEGGNCIDCDLKKGAQGHGPS